MGLSLGSIGGIGSIANSAIGATIGSLANAGASIYSAKKAAQASKYATNTSIAWERERAKNAHQWEAEDYKKAGYNPVLMNGDGALTSGITPPVPDTSGYARAGEGIGKALEFLNTAKKTDAEVQNLNADTANKEEQNSWIAPQAKSIIAEQQTNSALNSAQTQTEYNKQNLIMQEIALGKAEEDLKKTERGLTIQQKIQLENEIKQQKIRLKKEAKELDVDLLELDMQEKYLGSKTGKLLHNIGYGANDLKGAASIIGGAYGIHSAKKAAKGLAKENNYTTINNYNGKRR